MDHRSVIASKSSDEFIANVLDDRVQNESKDDQRICKIKQEK